MNTKFVVLSITHNILYCDILIARVMEKPKCFDHADVSPGDQLGRD
jgi:hypothetical protein